MSGTTYKRKSEVEDIIYRIWKVLIPSLEKGNIL
jgi:hypothetical protein